MSYLGGESQSLHELQTGKTGKTSNAYLIDERRRAALEEIDNAKFSCVCFPTTFKIRAYPDIGPFQLFPCQGLLGGWSWLLHRRVSVISLLQRVAS